MKLKRSTKFLIGSFVALSSIGFFMRSAFFNVKEIKVQAQTVEVKKLVEKMLADVIGQNIWDIEADKLASVLTNKSRTIQAVQFQRHWPDVLKVQVEERKAVAQTFIEGEMWIIDGDAITFKKKIADLPLYWPIPTERRVFHESLRWLALDQPKGVNGLTWDRELGLVAIYEKDTKIILGRDNFRENWKKATEAIEYLGTRKVNARKIDATYNNRAVVSL